MKQKIEKKNLARLPTYLLFQLLLSYSGNGHFLYFAGVQQFFLVFFVTPATFSLLIHASTNNILIYILSTTTESDPQHFAN